MLKRVNHPFIAGALLAGFLFVSVGLTGQVAAHTLPHAQHKAATHASLLCSWVCSAGQVLQAFHIEFSGPFLTMVRVESRIPWTTSHSLSWAPSSRAPPLFLHII